MSMTGVTCAEILNRFRDNNFPYFHTCKNTFVSIAYMTLLVTSAPRLVVQNASKWSDLCNYF